MAAHLTEYRCRRRQCPDCGTATLAPLPDEHATQFGPQLTALICLALSSATLFGRTATAQPPETRSTSGKEAVSTKRTRLNDLAAHRLSLPPLELAGVLREGIADSDPDVRATALWAVAGRAGGVRFATGAERAEKTAVLASERETLLTLWPLVPDRLRDPDEKVRRAALAAAGNLEYAPGQRDIRAVTIRPGFARTLAAMYVTESPPALRVEIVKSFALLTKEQTAPIQEEARAMLLSALEDQEPRVVAYAALAVGKQQITSALPDVVRLLSSDNKNVRLFAAQGIAAFGSQASQFAPAIEAAMANERDELISKTMAGTLKAIAAP